MKFFLGAFFSLILFNTLYAQYEMNVSPKALIESAQKGDPDAMFDLGNCMLEGICAGIPRDDSKAIYWMQRSAGLGNGPAQSMIGYFYCSGENKFISMDKKRGRKLLESAINSGDPVAKMISESVIGICN